LTAYALYAARTEIVMGIPALNFSLLIAAAGLPLYFVTKPTRKRKAAAS
jgi:hypothetical protein